MKKIKTFEDACKALKIDVALPDVSMLPESNQKSIVAFYKLSIIIESVNDGWKPNWGDKNELKYYNWFEVEVDNMGSSGFGFSTTAYDSWSTITTVGSRLCFKNRESAEYVRENFKSLYEDYLLIR